MEEIKLPWPIESIEAGVYFRVPGVSDNCILLFDDTMRDGQNWRVACLDTGRVGLACNRQDAANWLRLMNAIPFVPVMNVI